jgi:hypothetical protein
VRQFVLDGLVSGKYWPGDDCKWRVTGRNPYGACVSDGELGRSIHIDSANLCGKCLESNSKLLPSEQKVEYMPATRD